MTERSSTERALAGCMILGPQAIDEACAVGINPADLSDPAARSIIAAAMTRRAEARPVDTITLHADTGLAFEEIEACADGALTSAHARHYAEMVAGYVELDRYAALGRWIDKRLAGAKPDEAATIGAQIAGAVDRALQAGRPLDAGTLGAAAREWLDRMTAPEADCVLLDWPVDTLTQAIGRLDREVVWIIAQPSMGKTAFVIQWLLNLAEQGHVVSFASLESSRQLVASRALANWCPLNNYPIRQRRASAELVKQAYETADRLPKLVRVIDGGQRTLDQLYAWGRAEARLGSRLIVVDNTRHIKVRGNVDRVNEVAEISQRMKQLRDDTGVPVVMLHHSSVDKKNGKEDASWSSDIRKDTDIMLFLRHDEEKSKKPLYAGGAGLWAVMAVVEKNRDAPAGYGVRLKFEKDHQRFLAWGMMEDMDSERKDS
jgi:replicative DNA helicase